MSLGITFASLHPGTTVVIQCNAQRGEYHAMLIADGFVLVNTLAPADEISKSAGCDRSIWVGRTRFQLHPSEAERMAAFIDEVAA